MGEVLIDDARRAGEEGEKVSERSGEAWLERSEVEWRGGSGEHRRRGGREDTMMR